MTGSPSPRRERLRLALIRAVHRAEHGVTGLLARAAVRRGWTPAVLPYVGYAGPSRARVLARVVLSAPTVEPAAVRGVAGWRRLLTLERDGVPVEVELDGVRRTVRTDRAGLLDTTLEVRLRPGRASAWLRVTGREPQEATVLVFSPEAADGVVCDVDDTAWVTGLRHPLRAAWRTLAGSSADRHAVPGMAALLRTVVEGQQDPPVVYLSNGPWNLAGPVARFLDREGFPAGALLMTDWGVRPDRWFRDGRAHKSGALERLVADLPWVRWVLVGDDGEHDPEIYDGFARAHRDRTAAIALRQVGVERQDASTAAEDVGGVPVLRAPDGHQLLELLRASRGRR